MILAWMRGRNSPLFQRVPNDSLPTIRAYPILMPDTAVLVAAEWGLRKSHQILVYRKSTNLEASRELMSYFQVACPNSPVESVIRLVGHGNYLIQGLELGNAEYGSENLIAANFHLPVDILEDSGFDEISLLQSRVGRSLSSAE